MPSNSLSGTIDKAGMRIPAFYLSSSLTARLCCVSGHCRQCGERRRRQCGGRRESYDAGRETATRTEVSRGVLVAAGGDAAGHPHPRKVLSHSAQWGGVAAGVPQTWRVHAVFVICLQLPYLCVFGQLW